MGGAQVEHGERGVEAQRREDKVGEVGLLSEVEVHRLREVGHPVLQCVGSKSLVGWTDLSYHIFHFHVLIRDIQKVLGKADLAAKPRKKETHVGDARLRIGVSSANLSVAGSAQSVENWTRPGITV